MDSIRTLPRTNLPKLTRLLRSQGVDPTALEPAADLDELLPEDEAELTADGLDENWDVAPAGDVDPAPAEEPASEDSSLYVTSWSPSQGTEWDGDSFILCS